MKPFVAIDGVLDYLLFIFFRCISIDDCAQTEILVSGFGADSGSSTVLLPESAPNPLTSILVCAQSPIKMPSEVADFPLILSKYAS